MKIVGFQSGHDVSYTILENGVPLIHEELERIIRAKEPMGDGLKMFFEQNPDMGDIKHFSLGNFGGSGGRWASVCGIPEYQAKMHEMVAKNGGEYHNLGHHKSHASNAFFSSNFDEALVITIDGGGWEDYSTPTAFTVWEGKGNKINPIKFFPISFCLGCLWTESTTKIFGLSVGHPIGNQAGTVMGMATLGEPKYVEDIRVKNYTKLRDIANKHEQDKFDVAASLQKYTEDTVRKTLEPFITKYNPKKLCFSGGVSLNCVMMGKMFDWFPTVEDIYCDPVPYDGGLSLGSARYVWHHILDNPRIEWKDQSSSYLGRTYSKDVVLETIEQYKDKCEMSYVSDDEVLEHLHAQKIVSVFGGGSESGRRALGNRSILADPRHDSMKGVINEKVKHRQWFRPFAPSILKEYVKDWFVRDIDSPYMSFVLKFKDDMKSKAAAVSHYDGTGRLQTVTENNNKWYYNFIKKWNEKTNVPILLNTSFNDREPIVETPENAINCFLKTNIDYLYFFDYGILIKKINNG
tara:strand:+ start:623 stop:2182 length:1560 start_codon:yes stop_codon:yes gene_type:complete